MAEEDKGTPLRFTRNTCYQGTDYGPDYEEEVALVSGRWVNIFLSQGRAVPAKVSKKRLAQLRGPSSTPATEPENADPTPTTRGGGSASPGGGEPAGEGEGEDEEDAGDDVEGEGEEKDQTGPSVTPLPEDFPGVAELAAAGVTTVEGVRELEDVTNVSGIGPATSEEIEAALAEL